MHSTSSICVTGIYFRDFNLGDDAVANPTERSQRYDLIGINLHRFFLLKTHWIAKMFLLSGSVAFGHYTAIVRKESPMTWYSISDGFYHVSVTVKKKE